MGIQLISELEPKNSGSFALLDDKYIRGGLRVVETHDDLATIPTDRLKDGMLAMVTTPAKVLYIYNQPTNTWSLFSAGGEGGSVWACVGDNETIKITQNVDDWTQTISAINNIRTYKDYSVLPTEDVADNEVAYCKADVVVGLTTYKRGFYYYDLSSTSWLEVNSTIEIDSALSETSKRPVQNRVVTKALDEKVSKDDVDNVISKYSENPIQNKAVATALEDVKNSKTMTAEEYDALDDETKNDGSFYCISDTGEIYQNGIIYGGKQIFDVTQEEYDALTDEEKADNEYHCTDTGRIYINGILYGDKKPIELTFEEYKQLEADGLVEADVDYVIVSNEKGILLASEDVGYKDKTVHEALVTLEEDVENLIDDTNLTSTTSTLSANKIKGSVTHSFNTQDGKVKYLKLKLDINTISVVDIYGGKIEILGANNSGANPDYKTVKVVRHSYGDWSSYDAMQVPSVVSTKIGNLYYYPTDNYYYLQLNNYANFTVTGATTKPEIVASLPVATSEMTLIPESKFTTMGDLLAQTANRQVKTFDNTSSSTEKWYKICSALTGGIGCNIKLTASRADSTTTVQYFSALFRDNRYRYTSSYISRERTVYESMLIAEYSAYIIADANNDIWVHVPSYGKAIIEIDTRAITIDGTVGTPVEDYVYSSFEHQYDGRINDSATDTTSTWSSSKIASEISAKGTKTQYRGSRSIDISTGGKLTFIFSSEYASQAGCYMLLSNYNTEPLLIELGRNNIGQFSVTATHKSNSVDTITVTTAGDEYSWYVLQF